LISSCPEGASFSQHSLRKSVVTSHPAPASGTSTALFSFISQNWRAKKAIV
jgi:hypothetical protein